MSLYQSYSNKYPDIPVNAGFTFAGRCQEGSSATNSKLSIALTTDSTFCDRLSLADNYFQMLSYTSKVCLAELKEQDKHRLHAEFIETQTKGQRIIPEYEVPVPESCHEADEYHARLNAQLDKAQGMLDKTEKTGLIAKWSTQLGIPVSLLYVLISVL